MRLVGLKVFSRGEFPVIKQQCWVSVCGLYRMQCVCVNGGLAGNGQGETEGVGVDPVVR